MRLPRPAVTQLAVLAAAWLAAWTPAIAVTPECRNRLGARATQLDRELVQGDLRIRWAASGELAPSCRRTSGDDAVHDDSAPVSIRNLALQVAVAREFFRESLKLRDPLQAPRYRNATAITVLVMQPARGAGLAYDEVSLIPALGDAPAYCSLVIVVSPQLDFTRNPTGAHEMFHLFQYGYAMFKTPWLLEGMARWSERFFRPPQRTPIAPANTRCADIVTRSYAASAWWAQRWPLQSPAPAPGRLAWIRYLDGTPVLASPGVVTGDRVRKDLDIIADVSARESRLRNLPATSWPEQLQRSGQFSQTLCAALEGAGPQPGADE